MVPPSLSSDPMLSSLPIVGAIAALTSPIDDASRRSSSQLAPPRLIKRAPTAPNPSSFHPAPGTVTSGAGTTTPFFLHDVERNADGTATPGGRRPIVETLMNPTKKLASDADLSAPPLLLAPPPFALPPLTLLLRAPPARRTWKRAGWNVISASWLNVLLIMIPVAWAMEFTHQADTIVFVFSALAIIPLASLLGFATEQLALRVGDTLGGLLNATFGNAVSACWLPCRRSIAGLTPLVPALLPTQVELLISILALVKGELDIVQASMIGSVLSNVLLVLGMCCASRSCSLRPHLPQSTDPRRPLSPQSSPEDCAFTSRATRCARPSSTFRSSAPSSSPSASRPRSTSRTAGRSLSRPRASSSRRSSPSRAASPSSCCCSTSPTCCCASPSLYLCCPLALTLTAPPFSALASSSMLYTHVHFYKSVTPTQRRRLEAAMPDAGPAPPGSHVFRLPDWVPSHFGSSSSSASASSGASVRSRRRGADDDQTHEDGSNPQDADVPDVVHVVGEPDEEEEEELEVPQLTTIQVRPRSCLAHPPSRVPRLTLAPLARSRRPLSSCSSSSSSRVSRPSSSLAPSTCVAPSPSLGLSPRVPTDVRPFLIHPPGHDRDRQHLAHLHLAHPAAAHRVRPLARLSSLLVSRTSLTRPSHFSSNAAEHVTAVTVSVKDKIDLSLTIAVGSSIQIACVARRPSPVATPFSVRSLTFFCPSLRCRLFVIPFLTLLAWAIGQPLSLLFTAWETILLVLTVLLVNWVLNDGRANWIEGVCRPCVSLPSPPLLWPLTSRPFLSLPARRCHPDDDVHLARARLVVRVKPAPPPPPCRGATRRPTPRPPPFLLSSKTPDPTRALQISTLPPSLCLSSLGLSRTTLPCPS